MIIKTSIFRTPWLLAIFLLSPVFSHAQKVPRVIVRSQSDSNFLLSFRTGVGVVRMQSFNNLENYLEENAPGTASYLDVEMTYLFAQDWSLFSSIGAGSFNLAVPMDSSEAVFRGARTRFCLGIAPLFGNDRYLGSMGIGAYYNFFHSSTFRDVPKPTEDLRSADFGLVYRFVNRFETVTNQYLEVGMDVYADIANGPPSLLGLNLLVGYGFRL